MKAYMFIYKRKLFFHLINISFLLLGYSAFTQQSESIIVSPKGDTVIITPIPLIDINPKIGEIILELQSYNVQLKISKEIYEIDTTVLSIKKHFDAEKKKFVEDIEKLTPIKIENSRKEWLNNEEILTSWEQTVSDYITDIENTKFKIQRTKNTWELTRQSLKESDIPEESTERIEYVIKTTKGLLNDFKLKQDSIIIIQNRITDFRILVDEILINLEDLKKTLQSEYFIQDSPPLWNAGDSTAKVANVIAQIKTSWNEHARSIALFKGKNSSTAVIHLIIFIFLLLLFRYLNKDFKRHELSEDDETSNIQYFLSRYFLSSLLFALSFALALYPTMSPVIREIYTWLILIPSLLLYYRLVPKGLRIILFYIVILLFLDQIHIFFTEITSFKRFILIVQDLLYIWVMWTIVKNKSKITSATNRKWSKAIVRIGNILIIFAVISLLGTVVGYVNLSNVISTTLVSALVAPIALNLLVQIFKAFFTPLFKTSFFQHSNIIKRHDTKILSWIYSFLIYLAIFIWIRSILLSLGIAVRFGDWIVGLMETKWEWGTVVISFGGIFGFFTVIIVTYILINIIKYLLEDEIFPRVKLSRGVPGAISMVIRYTIVAFGIYLALTAAGVDLGQFGLIAGALGVGIGFGLQGVVYNFIAGLILAFERPIQKGDTIEMGTLLGDVVTIGVRASTIKTFEGSEVIVPNGNLISNELVNWTLSDRKRRKDIKIHVAYGNNPHEIMDLIYKVASENENVLPYPKPWALFDGFGDSSLEFRIRFWVVFDRGMTIQSQVAMEIYDALNDAGIQIPFPQTDLHVKSFDPTVQKIIHPFQKKEIKKSTNKKTSPPENQEDL